MALAVANELLKPWRDLWNLDHPDVAMHFGPYREGDRLVSTQNLMCPNGLVQHDQAL